MDESMISEDKLKLVDNFAQAERNAIHFSDVLNHPASFAFKRLGQFFHWYYFPEADSFAPSKFIGYQDTTLKDYDGSGTGSLTTKVLNTWFHKLEKDTALYIKLEGKLVDFLKSAGVNKSKKVNGGTGGIYVPLDGFNTTSFPEEVTDENFYEGAVKEVIVNKYERNAKARTACIAHHGCFCHACGFDFEKRYGKIGVGFIHVHHLKEISSIGKGYIIDPVNDLRPLCPNCHSMIHRKKPAMSIEELKGILI